MHYRCEVPGVLLCALAAVASAGVAATPATAAACVKESGRYTLCLGEPLALTEGTATVFATTDSSYRLATASGTAVECGSIGGLGALNSSKPSGGHNGVQILRLSLHFTDCFVSSGVLTGCLVAEPITTEAISGEISGKEKILFKPSTGTLVAVIRFAGEFCLIAGQDKLTTGKEAQGKPKPGILCTSPLETTREIQLLTCLADNSNLELLGEATTFEGDVMVKLGATGILPKWAVIEGK